MEEMFVGLSEGKTSKLELWCVSLRRRAWALQNAGRNEHLLMVTA